MQYSSVNEELKVCFITLGCAKNEVDTLHMKESATKAGYSLCEDPEEAHAIVLNSCSFIQSATEESIDTFFDLVGLAELKNHKAKLFLVGCMVSRYGQALKTELPEANVFLSCEQETELVQYLELAIGKPKTINSQVYKSQSASAYVKISDGCDRFCSYCTIPYIRGRYHSFAKENIFEEVEKLSSQGAREIVLIAQDTGRWGQDFDEPSTLAALVNELADTYPQLWFRIMYLQPEGLTDELLRVMADKSNVCKYLDIPLQHVNPEILKSMNRKGSYQEFVSLLNHVRDMVPSVVLRTTLIAGFPGETDEQFQELCDFIEEDFFDYVGVFAYSQEEGTKAATLPNQLSEEEKIDRQQTIRDLADALCTSRIAKRVGNQYDVLVEGKEEDGQLFGRAQCQAPEVDGVVYLSEGNIGEIVKVTISDTLLYEMEGE